MSEKISSPLSSSVESVTKLPTHGVKHGFTDALKDFFSNPDLSVTLLILLIICIGIFAYTIIRMIMWERTRRNNYDSDHVAENLPFCAFIYDLDLDKAYYTRHLSLGLDIRNKEDCSWHELITFFDDSSFETLSVLYKNLLQDNNRSFTYTSTLKNTERTFTINGEYMTAYGSQHRWIVVHINEINVLTLNDLNIANRKIQDQYDILSSLRTTVWKTDNLGNVVIANTIDPMPSFIKDLILKSLDEQETIEINFTFDDGKMVLVSDMDIDDIISDTFSLTINPYLHDSGSVGCISNITEVISLERELKNLKHKQDQILNVLPTPLIFLDDTHEIIFYNNAFLEFWDIKVYELMGNTSYRDLLYLLNRLRKMPTSSNQMDITIAQELKLLQTDEEKVCTWDIPNGQKIKIKFIPCENNTWLLSYYDITETNDIRSNAETLVKVQTETINALEEGVAVIETTGKITLYNQNFINFWNLDLKELQKSPHFSHVLDQMKPLFNNECQSDWRAFRENLLRSAIGNRSKTEHIWHLNNKRIIKQSATPLSNGGTLLTFTDLTLEEQVQIVLQQREESSMRSNEQKSNFIKVVSFKLRSAFQTIFANSQMLEQEKYGELNKRQKQYIENINKEVILMNHFMGNTLDLAMLQSQEIIPEIGIYNINDILEETTLTFSELSQEKNIQILHKPHESIMAVNTDSKILTNIIYQTMINIISNGQSGDKIHLEAYHSDDTLRINIHTTIVIPEYDHLQSTKNSPILFAGMALVKQYAQVLNGSIAIDTNVDNFNIISFTF